MFPHGCAGVSSPELRMSVIRGRYCAARFGMFAATRFVRDGYYIHLLRLKIQNSKAAKPTIKAIAIGYPKAQCSSGMVSKFMP